MSVRLQRFITGRDAPADSSRVLAVAPVWKGETLRAFYMDAYAMTRGAGAGRFGTGESSFPDQPTEINWHVLWIPWDIAATHSRNIPEQTSSQSGVGENVHPASVLNERDAGSEWDALFRNILFEWSASGSEYYGHGEADLEPIEVAQDRQAEADTTGAGAEAERASVAERGTMGNLGIIRLYGREVLMRPAISDGDGKVRFGDDINIQTQAKIAGPGFVVAGVVRYEISTETNWNAEINSVARQAARNMLIGGDAARVQAHILHDNSPIGDYIRTILFGGDTYVEADTLKGSHAKVSAKGVATVETPYSLIRFGS